MPKNVKQCPQCQIRLENIGLPELLNEKKKRVGVAEYPPGINSIFDFFSFHTCPECGLTLIYGGPEAHKLATEARDELLGNS